MQYVCTLTSKFSAVAAAAARGLPAGLYPCYTFSEGVTRTADVLDNDRSAINSPLFIYGLIRSE